MRECMLLLILATLVACGPATETNTEHTPPPTLGRSEEGCATSTVSPIPGSGQSPTEPTVASTPTPSSVPVAESVRQPTATSRPPTPLPAQPTCSILVTLEPGDEAERVVLADAEGGAAQDVVFQFLRAVSAGDREKAIRYVSPTASRHETEILSYIVDVWVTDQHRFIIGETTYGGLLGSGQYVHLDKDDPRVEDARVEVCINDGPVQGFSLELVDGRWQIWSVMVPIIGWGGR